MTIFVFGNADQQADNLAIRVSQRLGKIENINFEIIPPNGDLPVGEVINIMDAVYGIDKVTLITESDLGKLIMPPRVTPHDYDLGFQLKYLLKIGKIKKVNIVGLPVKGKIDYDRIHLIFKKLVAQDMHGS